MLKSFSRYSFFLLLNSIVIGDQDRPNIIWITSEDNSRDLYHIYNETGAYTPNLERLVEHGLVFENAYSQGPVCSVARSTLITGAYAPRIGAHYHRKTKLVPMPSNLKMFPSYLRNAGYYTSNNYKEDYNIVKSDNVWDESSSEATYKDRNKNQPFFHVQNFAITHEGKLHFTSKEMLEHFTKRSLDSIEVPPYLQDTKIVRYTIAKHYDLITELDIQIGNFLDDLQTQGLMDNTFVFYFGDHGGVLPRSKGYIYESGLKVPLIVYVPENWKHLVPVQKGNRINGIVTFIDMAPTVLNLAGIDIPPGIDGKPFLGKGVSKTELNNRNHVFGYADRFDEKYDFVRSLRKGKYKYIRNYQTLNIDGLFNFYRYRMLAYQELLIMNNADLLNQFQKLFFSKKPNESLYNLDTDPYEVNNLSNDNSYNEILIELRNELTNHLKDMPDLGFFPESYFLDYGADNPVQFGQRNKDRISKIINIADLSLKPFSDVKDNIKVALLSKDPWERYWALIVCSNFGEEAAYFLNYAETIFFEDEETLVSLRASEFLAHSNYMSKEKMFIYLMEKSKNPTEANIILNSIAVLDQTKTDYDIDISEKIFPDQWLTGKDNLLKVRMNFINDSFDGYEIFTKHLNLENGNK
ncbi:MAG: sulfatase [Candidatus Marinimicrobia bacterium]|nr:sulfatase [Candidatus Neomarinimicrobiota bacterium]|tara:strand:+ start:9777 stop:11684 length:1908 start_codon:yes stop_codon:yes gene_type:complete